MKKILTVSICLLLLLTGCKRSNSNELEKTVDKMISCIQDGNLGKAKTYFSSDVEEIDDLEMNLNNMNHSSSEMEEEIYDVVKELLDSIDYKILNSEVSEDEDKGSVEVKIQCIDLSQLISKYSASVLEYSMKNIAYVISGDIDEEKYADLLEETFDDVKKEKMDFNLTFYLEKENDNWYITSGIKEMINSIIGNFYDSLSNILNS